MSIKPHDQGLFPLLLLLFLLSGATALVYHTLWVRVFSLVCGVTVFALSCLLTAVMSGLALGTFYFGKLIDRHQSPLKVWILLEIGIGGYALIFLLLVEIVKVMHVYIYQTFHPGFIVLNGIRFILSFLIMI